MEDTVGNLHDIIVIILKIYGSKYLLISFACFTDVICLSYASAHNKRMDLIVLCM